jgi:hypothetical protein
MNQSLNVLNLISAYLIFRKRQTDQVLELLPIIMDITEVISKQSDTFISMQ